MDGRKLVVLGLIVVGVVAPTLAGAAPVFCKKKSGAVVVRDPACKKKETQLNLSQFGAVGPRGPQGLQGLQGSPGTPAAKVFAWVDQTAALHLSSSPAPTVSNPLTGVYKLTFSGLDLSNCVPVATPGQASNNGFFPTTQLDARIDSYPGQGGDIHTVDVFPTDASTGAAKAAAFNVAVFCP